MMSVQYYIGSPIAPDATSSLRDLYYTGPDANGVTALTLHATVNEAFSNGPNVYQIEIDPKVLSGFTSRNECVSEESILQLLQLCKIFENPRDIQKLYLPKANYTLGDLESRLLEAYNSVTASRLLSGLGVDGFHDQGKLQLINCNKPSLFNLVASSVCSNKETAQNIADKLPDTITELNTSYMKYANISSCSASKVYMVRSRENEQSYLFVKSYPYNQGVIEDYYALVALRALGGNAPNCSLLMDEGRAKIVTPYISGLTYAQARRLGNISSRVTLAKEFEKQALFWTALDHTDIHDENMMVQGGEIVLFDAGGALRCGCRGNTKEARYQFSDAVKKTHYADSWPYSLRTMSLNDVVQSYKAMHERMPAVSRELETTAKRVASLTGRPEDEVCREVQTEITEVIGKRCVNLQSRFEDQIQLESSIRSYHRRQRGLSKDI